MRDIRRNKPKPVAPKSRPKARVVAPVAPPAPAPPVVVGYIEKVAVGVWSAYVGVDNEPIILDEMEESASRMKDAVAWINEICEEKGYELKEVVKV